MTGFAASMVENFVRSLDGEPETGHGVKTKDLPKRQTLAECFRASLAGETTKETETGSDFYSSLAQTLKDLGL